MRKILFIAIIALIGVGSSSAQDFKTGIGVRGGWYSSGLTLKHFISETSAVELLLSGHGFGVNATGLYELYQGNVADVEYLNWFIGGGAHVGTWRGSSLHIAAGLDAIIGIEYTLTEFDLPFNISLDYKPGINITGGRFFIPEVLAFSFRYNFK